MISSNVSFQNGNARRNLRFEKTRTTARASVVASKAMRVSELNLAHVRTDSQFECYLLLQEIDRLLSKIGAAAECALPAVDTVHYACGDCVEGDVYDADSYRVISPVYCRFCGCKLAYTMRPEDGRKIIDWLASLVRRGIRIPHPNWADLSMALSGIPAHDPVWATVEYIVYAGSALDHELRCK